MGEYPAAEIKYCTHKKKGWGPFNEGEIMLLKKSPVVLRKTKDRSPITSTLPLSYTIGHLIN